MTDTSSADGVVPTPPAKTPTAKPKTEPKRTAKGQFVKGFSGQPGGDAGRARKALNLDTVREMHLAFQRGGRAAIEKVMKNQPAVFLKLLVLLVPRELEVTHSGGVKAMSDDQIEQAITVIEDMLAKRTGEQAKVIEASPVLPSTKPETGSADGSSG